MILPKKWCLLLAPDRWEKPAWPCGSGGKYKKCCLNDPHGKDRIIQGYIKDVMALDNLSNSINALIEKKDFQKAQAVCQRLLDEWMSTPIR